MKPNKYNANSNSGRFNKRIGIWGPTVTQDEIGNEIETFGEIMKLWSMVKTVKGSEYIAAAQTQTEKTVRFVVQYSKRLERLFDEHKTNIQIEYKENMYDVVAPPINDDELNKTFTIITQGRQ
ncbi:phage head closure protein [Paenibacillus senegalensis]|uniref:phage head closure protein n=1 Tax=Paenibacillus senegalensis TaxID=1465766 RepID=UPI00028822AB|nr:phage head closure protein [Paenibacillus senegalensis]